MQLNYLDIVLLLPIAYGLIQGIRHGIVKEVAALIAIIAGIYLARFWSPVLACHLVKWTGWSAGLSSTVAYVLIFVVIALGVHLLAHIVGRLLKAIMLGGVNRVFGAVFGVVKWVLILSVILNLVALIDTVLPLKGYPAVQNSMLYSHLEGLLWQILPGLDLENYIETLRSLPSATFAV